MKLIACGSLLRTSNLSVTVSMSSPLTIQVLKRRVNNSHKATVCKVSMGSCKQKKAQHLNRRRLGK